MCQQKAQARSPVLLIVFNRPDKARVVFERIRKARPRQLFIASDGPRAEVAGESTLCQRSRGIAELVDWPCEVRTLFQENNLGCKGAVTAAINWFFENVEQGLILEDDCVPSQSFFGFCDELLDRYKQDERIMMVSGMNPLGTWREKTQDYHFGRGGTWGWATWRRAWALFDVEMKLWKNVHAKQAVRNFLCDDLAAERYFQVFEEVYRNRIDTWDYQWAFCRYVNSGLSINPAKNLIENIGFGPDATHTFKKRDQPALHEMSGNIRENKLVVLDREFEETCAEANTPKGGQSGSLLRRMTKVLESGVKRTIGR